MIDTRFIVAKALFVFVFAPQIGALIAMAIAKAGGGQPWQLGWVGFVLGGLVAGFILLQDREGQGMVPRVEDTTEGTFQFPGGLLGGASLVVAPLLLLIGELFRIEFHFYFPSQLAAYAEHPLLMKLSYGFFAMGFVLMWPAFLELTHRIGLRKPGWALWGGSLAMTGLLVRLFHEGVNHQAFQLVDVQSLQTATQAVSDSYTAWYVLYPLVFTDNLGWIVLGVGAYLSGTLGWFGAFMLAAMSGHNSGVLKGTDAPSLASTVALCIAFVPLGIIVLRNAPRPSRRCVVWGLAFCGLLVFLYLYTTTPEIHLARLLGADSR